MKKIIINTNAIEVFKQEYIEKHDLTYSETLLINDFFDDIFNNHVFKEAE